MSYNAKKWSRLAVRLQRALGLSPPTIEEAEAEIAEAEEAPMSNTEISQIMDYVDQNDQKNKDKQ